MFFVSHSVAGLEPETVGADFIGAGAEPQKSLKTNIYIKLSQPQNQTLYGSSTLVIVLKFT